VNSARQGSALPVMTDPDSKIRDCIVRMLARREHAVVEVHQKLSQRGFDKERIEHIIALFQQENLISDARFAEAYVRSRVQRGYGPRHIEQALLAKQITADEVAIALGSFNEWIDLALQARVRRFGEGLPKDFKDKAKQMRFLQQRGFGHEHIRYAMAGEADG